ncbi:MAG: phosphoribosylformylglycinamidine synthase [Planctomycetaceae bacterium]|nr:phosphoribosylformylglycinamidine synthase [Planctomycetaceae bacterium]
MNEVFRVAVQRKPHAAAEADCLKSELQENLKIKGLADLEIANIYDIKGMTIEQVHAFAKILAEPMVDNVSVGKFDKRTDRQYLFKQALAGQFDQRADSAEQASLLSIGVDKIKIRNTVAYAFNKEVSAEDMARIESSLINPIESHKVNGEEPKTLDESMHAIKPVKEMTDFIHFTREQMQVFLAQNGYAMNLEDLLETQKYFRAENRNPNDIELKVLDTYWSDHCRHTTFGTKITNVQIDDSDPDFRNEIAKSLDNYQTDRQEVHGIRIGEKPACLMDLATINMKRQHKLGNLPDFVDDQIENNACTIKTNVNGVPYQILFKNETHNHPTEIEPFGGAATCLGGAIRDPLSGRAYVYQAMRVSGAADPTVDIDQTLPGKLPQRQITTGAANGFSSYGNQIGLATGHVNEKYHPGYAAKRMEVGFVVGAAPVSQINKEEPTAGDIVLLIGGRTGRDGIGGATGSSKSHDEKSLVSCGAEVQKGNAPTERKIQRLFRIPAFSIIVKKCNDFGAGGVSVAVGELADSLDIDLSRVPVKYAGLNAMERAISESQERMAVVIALKDLQKALAMCDAENLEVTQIASVTSSGYLNMFYDGERVVHLKRKFLNAAGAKRSQDVVISAPGGGNPFIRQKHNSFREMVLETMSDLNVASQKGLIEKFDSTVGGRTVLHPFGGKTQNTPTQGSAMLIPADQNYSATTIATQGFDPHLSQWSPFHGSQSAVLDSLAKIVAIGGDYKNAYLSFQEYMPRQKSPEKWGQTMAALLGANEILRDFGLAAIGGKDSISGTFKDIDVPPTLISFALTVGNANHVITPEFKKASANVGILNASHENGKLFSGETIRKKYDYLVEQIKAGNIISAYAVGAGGMIEAVSKMALGNEVGFKFNDNIPLDMLNNKCYGSIVVEAKDGVKLDDQFLSMLGQTTTERSIQFGGESVSLADILKIYESKLEPVFRTKTREDEVDVELRAQNTIQKSAVPDVFIPRSRKAEVVITVFPGTNSEDEMERAFRDAGAIVKEVCIRNLTSRHVAESAEQLARAINDSNIIVIPGGFSGGDEPDGAAKLIVSLFRNPKVAAATNEMLAKRDGLMLGVCNGFQALVKLGMFRHGQINEVDETYPTLGTNTIARHISEYVQVRVGPTNSPWLKYVKTGELYQVPVSHGEGKFLASDAEIARLVHNGQVFSQYADLNGKATMLRPYNPNGSKMAIEGIISPDGRVLGKMGHVERVPEHGQNVIGKNISGNKFMPIIPAGVDYVCRGTPMQL